jgi:pimeloyl-ACP methyl ester carboxylesterase
LVPEEITVARHDPDTLTEAWTILDGLPLFYRTNVKPPAVDARTIIHLHGFGISGTYLLPTASRLASEYATWVPDLPGFGRSAHPRHTLTIDELGEAVCRFMDQQGIDKAVLLGNSLGCPISAAFIEHHADRVDAAIWVSPAGGLHNLPIWRGASQLALAGMREPLGMVPIGARDYLHYGILPTMRLFESMLHYPVARRIAEMTLPTLVVIGDRDPLVSEDIVRKYADELPHVTAVAIEGAAHAINYSHPDQLANVVRSWLHDRPITDDPTAKGRVRIISARAGA